MLIAQIGDLMKIVSKLHVPIAYNFRKKYAVKQRYGRAKVSCFIVSNDSASPKMGIKMYFNFFPIFFKVLSCFNAFETTHIWLLKGTSWLRSLSITLWSLWREPKIRFSGNNETKQNRKLSSQKIIEIKTNFPQIMKQNALL